MGGLTAYFRRMREGDGLRGREEAPGDMVATGGSGEAAEVHVIRYFGLSEGEVATGIWQAWRGRGRRGGVSL